MKKRRRIRWIGFLCVSVPSGIVAFVLVLWTCLPSGYESTARKRDESVRRVDEVLAERPASGSAPARLSSTSPHAQAAGVSRRNEGVSAPPTSPTLETALSALCDGFEWPDEGLPPLNILIAEDYGIIRFDKSAFGLDDATSAISHPLPDTMEEISRILREEMKRQDSWYEDSGFQRHSDWRKNLAERIGRLSAKHHAAMDEIERVLLRERTEPGSFSSSDNGASRIQRGLDSFDIPVQLTLFRAALQGESEKAAALAARYVDLARAAHLRNYPYGQDRLLSSLAGLFVILAQVDGFGEEGYRLARASLESARIDAAKRNAFRIAHIVRSRDRLIRCLDEGRVRVEPSVVQEMFDGRLAAVVRRSVMPAMRNRVDRLATALIDGNKASIWASYQEMLIVSRALNLQTRNAGSYWVGFREGESDWNTLDISVPPRNDRLEQLSGAKFNDGTEVALLFLGLSHFLRLHARFPERIDELVPGFLTPALSRSEKGMWEIYAVTENPGTDGRGSVRHALVRVRKKEGAVTVESRWIRSIAGYTDNTLK